MEQEKEEDSFKKTSLKALFSLEPDLFPPIAHVHGDCLYKRGTRAKFHIHVDLKRQTLKLKAPPVYVYYVLCTAGLEFQASSRRDQGNPKGLQGYYGI